MKIKYKRLNLKDWMIKYAAELDPNKDLSAVNPLLRLRYLDHFSKTYPHMSSCQMSDGWYKESDGALTYCYFSINNKQYTYPDPLMFDCELERINAKECPLTTCDIKSVLSVCDKYPGLLAKSQKAFLDSVLVYRSVQWMFSERKLSMRKRLKKFKQLEG